jgi:hypothetical protein
MLLVEPRRGIPHTHEKQCAQYSSHATNDHLYTKPTIIVRRANFAGIRDAGLVFTLDPWQGSYRFA